MLSLLLPLVIIVIFLIRLGSYDSKDEDARPWQGEFLITAAIWGALLVAITEGLSLFFAINRLWLAISWSILLAVVIRMGWRTDRIVLGWKRMKEGFRLKSKLEIVFLTAMGAIAGLLFLVAVVAPSNNIDALQYHLPRVVHWAQNQSLGHFPVAQGAQNFRPYWAESAVLNLRVLWGTDRPVNLIQWFAMVGSVIGVTGIVTHLDGDRKAQLLAAVFAFSIPMGVLQSTTTQNDYVSAFWVACLAYFVTLSKKRELNRAEFISLSLSLALGMLTKGTFFLFAGPLMIWFFIPRIIHKGIVRIAIEGTVVIAIVVLLNGPFWFRNVVTYGGPFGKGIPVTLPGIGIRNLQDNFVQQDLFEAPLRGNQSDPTFNGTMTLNMGDPSSLPISTMGSGSSIISDLHEIVEAFLAKLARMIMMNFVLPFYGFNTLLFRALSAYPETFSPTYVGSLKISAWNNEMSAGSPLHFSLIFVSMILIGLRSLKGSKGYLAQYSLVAVLGYILLPLINVGDVIFAIRYQLAFFVVSAPVFACAFAGMGKRVPYLMMIGLLLYSLPYVFLNNMTPVIGHTPWPTRVESVFTADLTEIMFAQSPENRDEYRILTERIHEEGCTKVGLSIGPKDQEYTLWWLLDAPQSGLQIEHITFPYVLNKYHDSEFSPCAILCTRCEGQQYFQNLPLAIDAGHIQLFSKFE